MWEGVNKHKKSLSMAVLRPRFEPGTSRILSSSARRGKIESCFVGKQDFPSFHWNIHTELNSLQITGVDLQKSTVYSLQFLQTGSRFTSSGPTWIKTKVDERLVAWTSHIKCHQHHHHHHHQLHTWRNDTCMDNAPIMRSNLRVGCKRDIQIREGFVQKIHFLFSDCIKH
jgi:hypothetical protein